MAILALVTVFALVLPASATTDRVPFTSQASLLEVLGVGREWSSPGTVAHVRGWTGVYDDHSDEPLYSGINTIVANWNVDGATGLGRMWGTFRLDLYASDGGYTGTWVADMTGDERGWIGYGVGQGYGKVEGYQLRFDVAANGTSTGYIMTPGNK